AEIRLRTSEKMPNRKSRCRTSSMRCREELAYSSATHIVPFRERIRYDEPSPEKSARRKAATDPRRARKIADGTFFSTDRQAQPCDSSQACAWFFVFTPPRPRRFTRVSPKRPTGHTAH